MPRFNSLHSLMKKMKKVNWSDTLGITVKGIILTFLILFLTFFLVFLMDSRIDIIDSLSSIKESSIIYDNKNKEVARLFEENRIYVELSKIPPLMQHALIAIEDARFYDHRGIDFRGILRALWTDIRSGGFEQGASTITQQLARNVFLSRERTVLRKLREALIAMRIEKTHTKEQILELYLNYIYFGHRAYGVEAAAQIYFGKHVQELTLSEIALLAGLPKGPSIYSPYVNLEKALARRNTVLRRMVELGYISEDDMKKAKSEPVKLKELAPFKNAPYFVSYVIQQLEKTGKFTEEDLYTGGYRIYTTLDLQIQKAAEDALKRNFPEGTPDQNGVPQPQAAIICLDPKTGYILAMVGGTDFAKTQLNRTMALRQPGSAIKPFTYVAAIDSKRFSPSTIMNDVRPVFEDGYSPKNYNDTYLGPITLRRALEISSNAVTTQLTHSVGISTVIRYAQRMGLQNLVADDYNLASISLGGLTKGVNLLELTAAYTPFANQGVKVEPMAIIKVLDKNGQVIDKINKPQRKVVLSENTAYVITDMLRGVIENKEWGTARVVNINRPAAGKTGTAQDKTNAWFIGYTPDLIAGVWIGNDQQKLPTEYSSYHAALIWSSFMSQALKGIPPSEFPIPDNLVVGVPIDVTTGALAGIDTPAENVRNEIFLPGTEPQFYSNEIERVEICAESGLIATSGCPREKVFVKLYLQSSGQNLLDGSIKPDKECYIHGPAYVEVDICIKSNKRPTHFCPPEFIEKRKFIAGTEPDANDLCTIHGFSEE